MRLALIVAAFLLAACAPSAEPPEAPVALTVFHEGGGAEPEALGLLNTWRLSGPATAMTVSDLRSLPQTTIETGYPLGAAAQHWSGPRLSSLLAALDAADAGARLTAVDGYQVEISSEDIDAYEPVLAIRRDGDLLGLGGLGPAILVWPRDTDPALADMPDDQWPWAVFAIEVLEPGNG
ncbi:MAG: hypothetical protein ACFE0P_14660 [Oceanicaulis sp.]